MKLAMSFIPVTRFRRPTAPWALHWRDELPAPPARAWKALVDPADLAGWWCDSAQVEERSGGRYAFGGKHAYGGEASAEITAWEPPSLLEFRWPLGGVDTTVRYELEESMDETVIDVVQSAASPPGNAPGPGMPSWWWVAIPALKSHLAKGKADLRIDWTARADAFSVTVPVSTFPWIIWWKLTDPRELERWWARQAEVDPVPGGAFRLGLESMGPETAIEVEPGRRLLHDWTWPGGNRTQVEWTVETTDEDTLLGVRDLGPDPGSPNPGAPDPRPLYWGAHVLALKDMSERGFSARDRSER